MKNAGNIARTATGISISVNRLKIEMGYDDPIPANGQGIDPTSRLAEHLPAQEPEQPCHQLLYSSVQHSMWAHTDIPCLTWKY
jgi:hypothetical protein